MEYLDGPNCVNIDTTSWGKKNFDFQTFPFRRGAGQKAHKLEGEL